MVRWMPPPFRPPRRLIAQASGICFTPDGEVVLVTPDGSAWGLPGGALEPGEEAAHALEREVREEARARVLRSVYLGCQRVDDPGHPAGSTRNYQTRFWARVTLDPFTPGSEIVGRRLVKPEHFLATLSWGRVPIATILLERALAVERADRSAGDLWYPAQGRVSAQFGRDGT